MPRPHSNYVDDAIWDDQNKVKSREEAIIISYHNHIGRTSIPDDKQYWTMCGAYYNKKQNLHGELGQLLDAGLIKSEQFYGVDREHQIIHHNKKIHPTINWIYGDFREVMGDFALNNNFNPAIINYDGVMQPEFGSQYLKSIMRFIDNNVKHELLLVANFVLKSPYRSTVKFKPIDVLVKLSKIYLFPDHWKLNPTTYVYDGTGKRSHTKMCIFVFTKNSHEKIIYTENRKII